MNTQNALIEGAKQFLRVIFLSILPILITYATEWQSTGKLDLKIAGISLIVAVLMGIDRWVHKDPNMAISGITPIK